MVVHETRLILGVSPEPILSMRDLVKGEQSIETDWVIRIWGYFNNLEEDGVRLNAVRNFRDFKNFKGSTF